MVVIFFLITKPFRALGRPVLILRWRDIYIIGALKSEGSLSLGRGGLPSYLREES
jgi:hypothetical protein